MNGEYVTRSPEETHALGRRLGEVLASLPGPVIIAYRGGLGAGKTAFTRGFARGLGNTSYVSSPTFALVNDYGGNPQLVHFDMYKVDSWDDLYSSGFFDYYDMGAILCTEWSENIENALPDDTIYVEFTRIDDEKREITITKKGE